eukprot:TRINITY_DN47_c0_g1_i4.p1 TRINITY_DN47_c0_g1~~TRINITY_DN47_c0_g1_i4.p1  ORF type:complete len:1461 (-),score=532.06 TRINITY_DN47_c0_g1_i4:637-5019(-)
MRVFQRTSVFLVLLCICVAVFATETTELSGCKVCRRDGSVNQATKWPLFGPNGVVDRNLGSYPELWDCDNDKDYCEINEDEAKKPSENEYTVGIAVATGVPVIFAVFLLLCFPVFFVGRYICCCPSSSRGCCGGTNPTKKSACCPLGYTVTKPKKKKKSEPKYALKGRLFVKLMMCIFIASVVYGMYLAYTHASLSDSASNISETVPLPFSQVLVDIQTPIKTILVDIVSTTVVGGVTDMKNVIDTHVDIDTTVDAVMGLVDVVDELDSINLDDVRDALTYINNTFDLLPSSDDITTMKALIDDLVDLLDYVKALAEIFDEIDTINASWTDVYATLNNPLNHATKPGVIPKVEKIIEFFTNAVDNTSNGSFAYLITQLRTSSAYLTDHVADFQANGSALGSGAAAVSERSTMRENIVASESLLDGIETAGNDMNGYLSDAKKLSISDDAGGNLEIFVLATMDELINALKAFRTDIITPLPTYLDFSTNFMGIKNIIQNKIGDVTPYLNLLSDVKQIIADPFDTTKLFAAVDEIVALDRPELYADMDALLAALTNVEDNLISLPDEVDDVKDVISDGKSTIKSAVADVDQIHDGYDEYEKATKDLTVTKLESYETFFQEIKSQKGGVSSVDYDGIDAEVKKVLQIDTSPLDALCSADGTTGKIPELKAEMQSFGGKFSVDFTDSKTAIDEAFDAFRAFSAGICEDLSTLCYNSGDGKSPDGYQYPITCPSGTCNNAKSGYGLCTSGPTPCTSDTVCGAGTCQLPILNVESSKVSQELDDSLREAEDTITQMKPQLNVGTEITDAKTTLTSMNSDLSSMDLTSVQPIIDSLKDVEDPDLEGMKSALDDINGATADIKEIHDQTTDIDHEISEFENIKDTLVDQMGTVKTRTDGMKDLLKTKIDLWTGKLATAPVEAKLEADGIAGVLQLIQDVAEEAYDFINEHLMDKGVTTYDLDSQYEYNDIEVIPRIRDFFTVLSRFDTSADIVKPLDLLVDLFNAVNYGTIGTTPTAEAKDMFDAGIYLVTATDGTVYKDANHERYGDDTYCVSEECIKNTATLLWDKPVQDSLDEFDVDDVTLDGMPSAKTLMLTQFLFPVLIALCGGISIIPITKKWGCFPSCCTMCCVCMYLPFLLIIAGGAFWPTTMIIADVCASGEDVAHFHIANKASTLCEDQIDGFVDSAVWDASTSKCRITMGLFDDRVLDFELDLINVYDNVVGSCQDSTDDKSKDVLKPLWTGIDNAMASYPKQRIDDQIKNLGDGFEIKGDLLSSITGTTTNLSTDVSKLIDDFSNIADCNHVNSFYVAFKDTVCCDIFGIWYHVVLAWVIVMWGMCLCACPSSILGQKRFQSKINPKKTKKQRAMDRKQETLAVVPLLGNVAAPTPCPVPPSPYQSQTNPLGNNNNVHVVNMSSGMAQAPMAHAEVVQAPLLDTPYPINDNSMGYQQQIPQPVPMAMPGNDGNGKF